MKRNKMFTVFVLCGLLGFAQLGLAVVITTDGIGSSLTGDDFGHITNFTVGGIQHLSYVSYFLAVDGGAPIEVVGANFKDVGDDPAVYFEPGNFQDYTDEDNEYTNVIRTNDDTFVVGFGVRLRDHSRASLNRVAWEPTMQITNISDDPITIEAMRYTQGLGLVNFVNIDGIAGSMDDAAYYWNSAGYVDPFGLTTSRQLDTNGNLLVNIRAGGAGFALNNDVGNQAAPGESAFITEPFIIQPGGRIITNYTINVTAAGNAALEPLDVSINFANVGVSPDTDPGGLVVGGVFTGAPLGGSENVQAPLVRVSSIRRWSFATTIIGNPGATADLTFEYDAVADDIPDEDTLELATREMLTDKWVKWDNVVRDTVDNTITAVGITENELNSLWAFAFTEDIPVIRHGDVSGDGNVTAYDASLILQYCVGLITQFPVEMMSATQNAVPQDYEISIPDLSAHAGSRVVVPVVIDKTAGLAAGGISVKYDETLLRANKTLSALNGAYWQANSDLVGEIRFAFAAFSQIQSDGELFTIEFEVLPCEEGTVGKIELSDVQLAESKSIHLRNGSIELLPAHTRLLANYPNPFNPETWIPYRLAKNANVHISIFNVNGKLIRTLNVGFCSAGSYIDKDRATYYDGLDNSGERVSSGIYFYTIKAGDFSATRKMTILK